MVEQAEEKKTDWLVPAAIVLGGAGMAAGLYFYMKKPSGLDPGDILVARFTFKYKGEGGTYVLQVSLGNILIEQWFDHIDGLTWTKNIGIPRAGTYTGDLECPLPAALAPKVYDAEALIRRPDMSAFDYLIKRVQADAVNVRKS